MTQNMVAFMTVIYYSEMTQSKISKGKGSWGGDQKKTGVRYRESSFYGITQDQLSSPEARNCDNTHAVLSTWEAQWRFSTQGL